MKLFKRFLCLALAVVMIALVLAACDGDADVDGNVNVPDNTTVGDTTTAPTTTEPVTTEPVPTGPASTVPPCAEHTLPADALCTDVKVCTVCGTSVPAGEHEYYAGYCTDDRPCKHCSYILPAAADHKFGSAYSCGTQFCENCSIIMYGMRCDRPNPMNDPCTICGLKTPPAIPFITVDKIAISEFTIVIPSQNNTIGTEYAKYIASLIDHRVNMWHKVDLDIVNDKTEKSGPEIRIGPTNRTVTECGDDEYIIRVVGGDLEILCGKMYSYEGLIDKIATILTSQAQDGVAFKSGEDITASFTSKPEDALMGDVRIMFHNVYQFGTNVNIRSRYSMFHMFYEHYMPDVIGMQEANAKYWDFTNAALVKNYLKKIGYGTVGENEGFAEIVYYNQKTLEVVWSNVNKTAGNYGTTSVLFKHKATGKYFGVCNSHFAANSVAANATEGNEMRIRDAYSVVDGKNKLIAEAKRLNLPNADSLAIIAGGDYNSRVGDDPVNVVANADFINAREAVDDSNMVDDLCAHDSAPKYINEYDYHGPNYYTNSVGSGKDSIDHCYTFGEGITFTANQYRVMTNLVSRGTADHCAHYLDITLK